VNADEWISLLSAMLTVATIVLGIWVYWRQINAQLFLEFTRRYDEVMAPMRRAGAGVDLSTVGSLPGDEYDLVLLRYLNLCSEEFYLYTNNYMAKRVWMIWKADIERTLKSANVRSRWTAGMYKEFESFPAFSDWVNSVLKGM